MAGQAKPIASRLRGVVVTGLLGGVLAACAPATNPDGTQAVAFIATEVGRVAQACAAEGFNPSAVRLRLIEEGFVERQRPGILQLERFPEGAGALTQGVTTKSRAPCAPMVNARFGQESINAAGNALIAAGYRPTNDQSIFMRGTQQVRLQSSALEIGGLATIRIEPVN